MKLLSLRSTAKAFSPCVTFAWLLCASLSAHALANIDPIPGEMSSDHFTVAIDGKSSPVVHAVAGYYLLNFEMNDPVQVTITAKDPHYWDAGVEVQPVRWGIRPHRDGASITFSLAGPAKLSITRPGDHSGTSEMLFLFANEPDRSGISAQTPGVRYYGPGVYHENIDAQDGDHIYLAAGAVIFGALNIWQVHDVHVAGRGMIVYDGPQNPIHDTGWIHKPNWHAIVMDDAFHIDIEGITAIVRSRTWMIQMRGSHDVSFRNVKVIGGSSGNANQDGMDWLGGGDAVVQDSFIRAADDIFAMYSDWAGYNQDAFSTPGLEVSNITIETSVLSTSISNVVRSNWPRKNLDSHHFTLRDSDVIHMGNGSCGVPFALLEVWADPAGSGRQTDYTFENIRLEDWYSLTQLRQPGLGIRNIRFQNISAMDGPGLVPSAFTGDVADVMFRNVNVGSGYVRQNSDLPLQVSDGAQQPTYNNSATAPGFTYSDGLIRPGRQVTFTAVPREGVQYHWLFGDGASADGASVQHAFPDALGTLLDSSGRFRVLLATRDAGDHTEWASQSVVVAPTLLPAEHGSKSKSVAGLAPLQSDANSFEGLLAIPASGGYTLTLLTSTTASLTIDGKRSVSRQPQAQVCGSKGNAVQAVQVSVALTSGLHRIQIARGAEIENAEENAGSSTGPVLLWEGPGLLRQPIPSTALSHRVP